LFPQKPWHEILMVELLEREEDAFKLNAEVSQWLVTDNPQISRDEVSTIRVSGWTHTQLEWLSQLRTMMH
jgi:hypothetical protein